MLFGNKAPKWAFVLKSKLLTVKKLYLMSQKLWNTNINICKYGKWKADILSKNQ